MPNGNGNGKEFKLVSLTRTNLTQVHSDEVQLNNGEVLNAAKEFDNRGEADSAIAELLGVREADIKQQMIEEDGMVTFVGAFADVQADERTGDSFITTKTVTMVTKRKHVDDQED